MSFKSTVDSVEFCHKSKICLMQRKSLIMYINFEQRKDIYAVCYFVPCIFIKTGSSGGS